MCGRFALGIPHYDIQQMDGYNVQVGEWVNQDQYHPRHNIAPRSQAPVVRRRRDGPADASESSGAVSNSGSEELVLHTMKWGLVPHWSKHEDLTLNTINARGENLVDGTGMWKSLRGWKRCVIPCEGYYEWLKKGKERLPHFTKRSDGKLLLLAGLYDSVVLEGQTEPLFTFTIVTTEASKEFSWLHDRQPMMLSTTESLNLWLDTTNHKWDSKIVELIQPYHDQDAPLTCYQVPKEVGKVGAESPTFIEPIADRKDGIQAMFARQAHKPITSPSNSQIKPEPMTPVKRKRSSSPLPSLSPKKFKSPSKQAKKPHNEHNVNPKEVIDLCDSSEDSADVKTETKAEKMNMCEDKAIEYVDEPSSSQNKTPTKLPSASKTKISPGAKTPSSPKKANKPPNASDAKITAFFNRSKA